MNPGHLYCTCKCWQLYNLLSNYSIGKIWSKEEIRDIYLIQCCSGTPDIHPSSGQPRSLRIHLRSVRCTAQFRHPMTAAWSLFQFSAGNERFWLDRRMRMMSHWIVGRSLVLLQCMIYQAFNIINILTFWRKYQCKNTVFKSKMHAWNVLSLTILIFLRWRHPEPILPIGQIHWWPPAKSWHLPPGPQMPSTNTNQIYVSPILFQLL